MTQITIMEQRAVSDEGANTLKDFVNDYFAALSTQSTVKLTFTHNHPDDESDESDDDGEDNPYRFQAQLEISGPLFGREPLFRTVYGGNLEEILKNFVDQAGAFSAGPNIRVEGTCPSLIATESNELEEDDESDEGDDEYDDTEEYDTLNTAAAAGPSETWGFPAGVIRLDNPQDLGRLISAVLGTAGLDADVGNPRVVGGALAGALSQAVPEKKTTIPDVCPCGCGTTKADVERANEIFSQVFTNLLGRRMRPS